MVSVANLVESILGRLENEAVVFIPAYTMSYTKNQDGRHWFNDDYDTLESMVKIDDFEVSMKDIYHKVLPAK